MLNLRVLSPKGIKSSISISSSSSIGELRKLCCDVFDVHVTLVDMLWGFPPHLITLEDDECVLNNIDNNETIRLQLKENAQVIIQGKSPPMKTKGTKKTTTTATTSSTCSSSSGFGARIASIANGKVVHEKRNIETKSNNSKNKKQKTDNSYWEKLVNDAIKDTEPNSNRVKATVRGSRSTAGSEGDITEHLIAAANGETNSRGKNFRKVFKTAVELTYAWTLSVQRLGSLYSGHYTIEECENSRILASGASTILKCRFQKGPSSRSYHEDEVSLVPIPLLKTMLEYALNDKEGNGRELLKPANMARATKQIFWSLVKHYGPDIPSTLKSLFPNITDWCWLTERTRELSEKAKRNVQQQKELAEEKARKGKKRQMQNNDSLEINDDLNNAVDLTVDNDDLNTNDTITKVDNNSNENMNPELVKELERCGSIESIVPEEWIDKVLIVIGATDDITNHILLLANYTGKLPNDADDKANLESKNLVDAIRQLDEEKGDAPTLEQCDNWIATAQMLIVKTYWSFICGQNYRLWYAIRYHLLTVSPVQMKLWIKNPDRFYDALITADPGLQNISLKNPFKISSETKSSPPYYVTEDPPGTIPILHKQSIHKSSSFSITDDPVVFLKKPFQSSPTTSSSSTSATSASFPTHNREYVLFSREWVTWMSTISLQVLSIAWMNFYDGTLDDENDDSNDDDESNMDESEDEWLYNVTDNKYIGKRVRISIDDHFTQEGKIIGYLPPTTDEPMALWKAELDEMFGMNSKKTKAKYQDLELHELIAALM